MYMEKYILSVSSPDLNFYQIYLMLLHSSNSCGDFR